MLNFTVGPVQSDESILAIGAEQVPYFRTSEFSETMIENERIIKHLTKSHPGARAVFLTGSGTASMEAAIMNTLTHNDKALVINGGSFGQRFVELCSIHDVPYTEIKPSYGNFVTEEQLDEFDGKGYTAFLVNMLETSTGVLYNMDIICKFCKQNNLFLIVDAISSFLADPIDMDKMGIDVLITGSQKALACPPGVSIIVLSTEAIERINCCEIKSMYFNLKNALKNGKRGQTPFTPAVGILLQINARLKEIEANGGVETETKKIATIANDFRRKINDLSLEIATNSMSNAVTPIHPINVSAYDLFLTLKDEYNIWVCPNGDALAEKIFRVGHIGAITIEDNNTLIEAFKDMAHRGLL